MTTKKSTGRKKSTVKSDSRKYGIVAVGTSLGGLNAMETILRRLPGKIEIPIIFVQHRLETAESNLLTLLQSYTKLPLSEPDDKQAIEDGVVYIAPAGYHLLVDDGHFVLSTDMRVQYSRPSIDVLFDSVADEYAKRAVGVVLTGANEDGARGLRKIKQAGGLTIVEDPEYAESPVMPKAAIEAASPDHVLSLKEMGSFIKSLVIKV